MRRVLLAFVAWLWCAGALAAQAPLYFPPPNVNISSTIDPVLMDAALEEVGYIFFAPAAGDLSGMTIFTGTVTTGQGLTGSYQDVDLATGMPDDVPDQVGTVSVADGDDDTFKTFTTATNRTVARGELVAFDVEWTATAGNLNLAQSDASVFSGNIGIAHKTSSAWADTDRLPMMVVIYSDGSRYPTNGALPGRLTNESFSSSSTPDERGNIWTPDAPLTVSGCVVTIDLDGDASCVLYDTDGSTVLASGTADKDVRSSTSQQVFIIPFTATATVAASSSYRLVIKPTTTTAVSLKLLTVTTAADLNAWWFGSDMHSTTRVDAGSWSQGTTIQYLVYPIVTGAGTDAGGGGSGGAHVLGGTVVK